MEPEEPQQSMRALAARSRSGEPAAVEELMSEVHRVATRYCRARLARFPWASDAVEDAAQEVCVAVLTALPRYDERGLPFEAFVYSIAARKVADVQRSTMRRPVPTGDVPEDVEMGPSPEELAVGADESARAWALLDRLSAQHRELLTLRLAVGLTAQETADALGMTPGAVRVAQHRALNKLRQMMGGEDD